MAANNTRGTNRGRTGKNNNPAGHNQYDRGLVDSAKERPFTAAAAIGGAVAAGVFLWTKRNQISDQISGLSEQLNEWREGMSANSDSFIARSSSGTIKTQAEIAEEALTLKETGSTSTHPVDPIVEEQFKVGAVAY